MRNNKVKSERGNTQKEIFLHTNKFQQWFSILSTPKEFVKGEKRKKTSCMLPRIIPRTILKVSAPTLWNLRSMCKVKNVENMQNTE